MSQTRTRSAELHGGARDAGIRGQPTATVEEFALVLIAIVLANVAVVVLYWRRYIRVPPNRALIVYGTRRPDRRRVVISGGGKFVTPIVEAYDWLSLEAFSVDVVLDRVVVGLNSGSPVRAKVRASAVAKIGSGQDTLLRAAESLLGKPREELERLVRGLVEGHIRGAFASTSWATLQSDPSPAIGVAWTRASNDLGKVGLVLTSLQVVEFHREGQDAEVPLRPDDVVRRIDALEARLRRVEERLGIRPP